MSDLNSRYVLFIGHYKGNLNYSDVIEDKTTAFSCEDYFTNKLPFYDYKRIKFLNRKFDALVLVLNINKYS